MFSLSLENYKLNIRHAMAYVPFKWGSICFQTLKSSEAQQRTIFCINSLYSWIIFSLYLSLLYIHFIIQAQDNDMIGHCVWLTCISAGKAFKCLITIWALNIYGTQKPSLYCIQRSNRWNKLTVSLTKKKKKKIQFQFQRPCVRVVGH